MRTIWIAHRLMQFRHDLAKLWRAFLDPKTPLWLKAAMIGVVLYLVSPLDLIPEFLLGLGIVDDLILVPLMLSWIAKYVPEENAEPAAEPTRTRDGKTIDGTARRM
jgi:uncharacterized membrane protein YkvA (DUF1232 family)